MAQKTIVDLNQTCIDYTRKKLGHHVNEYYVNDGKSLPVIDNSYDLIFSFDSFVHMHKNVIEEYVKEIHRVLKPGGTSFIHHSWLGGGEELSFENLGGRSNMDCETFKNIVESNNMIIKSQDVLQYSKDIYDIITVFVKP